MLLYKLVSLFNVPRQFKVYMREIYIYVPYLSRSFYKEKLKYYLLKSLKIE